MKSIEEVQAERARLAAEYGPRIQAARAELEEAEAEFAAARERRNAAQDKHRRLVDRYTDEHTIVGKE